MKNHLLTLAKEDCDINDGYEEMYKNTLTEYLKDEKEVTCYNLICDTIDEEIYEDNIEIIEECKRISNIKGKFNKEYMDIVINLAKSDKFEDIIKLMLLINLDMSYHIKNYSDLLDNEEDEILNKKGLKYKNDYESFLFPVFERLSKVYSRKRFQYFFMIFEHAFSRIIFEDGTFSLN